LNILNISNDITLNETIHVKLQDNPIVPKIEDKFLVNYVPGGCSYNTMRVFNVGYLLNISGFLQMKLMKSTRQQYWAQLEIA